jgi:hypothetical protein
MTGWNTIMNQSTSTDDLQNGPVEDLDRLLSDFFKSQMKKPWPAAPAVTSEPSVFVAARTAEVESPRNQPAGRDTGTRARYTLAASVALLLGTGWFLSNGFQPAERPGPLPGVAPKGIGDATASDPEVLKKLREEKARNGEGFVIPKAEPPKIDLP